MIGLAIVGALCVWAFAACVFTGVAIREVRRSHAASRAAIETVAQRGSWPRIALLRPCEGLDPDLEENLLASATAPYGGLREVWVCVPSTGDPAHAVALRAQAEAQRLAPEVPFEVLVTGITTDQNRKAAHLGVAELRTRAPVLVIADSDVALDAEALPALIAALEADPQAGASCAPPIDVRPRTLGDHASAALLSSTPHALLSLSALSDYSRSQTLLAGALLACRRDVLLSAGGFRALEPYLGEDFELARRLHAMGRPVRVSARPARFTDEGRSVAAVVARYARWSLVVRRQRPWLFSTYFLLLGCTPALLAGSVAASIWARPYGLVALFGAALLLGLRVRLAEVLRRAYGVAGGRGRALVAVLLGESLVFAGAALAGVRSKVVWRGRPFRVGRRGELEPMAS